MTHNQDASSSPFAKALNPPQLDAVETLHGPLLILAGAGSGKTRVLTFRISNLILQGEASPEEILAVTFTNKAAREMKERTRLLLKDMEIPLYGEPWITTFHSACTRILRDQIVHLGYQPFFVIYDDSDQLSLIKRILHKLDIDDKVYPAKTFKNRINEAKTKGLTPQKLKDSKRSHFDDMSLEVYSQYEMETKKANALDFSDLLIKTHELFVQHPNILKAYQDKLKFILVDEYQDTNKIQYQLIKLLCASHHNICVVGDEDQSIYSWRGADISNILSFEKDFPNCKTIKLEENYRSTKTIVEAASHLIQKNTQRKGKVLFTNNTQGSMVQIQEEHNEYDEARFVVKGIREFCESGTYSYNDCAIFYRTNAQSRVLEEQLRSHSIPYRLIGGLKFYDRKEVKDIISYFRVLLNSSDDVAFKRIINVPPRGLGKTTVLKIEELSNDRNITFYEAIQKVVDERLVNSGAVKKLGVFKELIDQLRDSVKTTPLSELTIKILHDTNFLAALKKDTSPEAQSRIENIEELHNAIFQFEKEREQDASLVNFLEEMALVSEADSVDPSQKAVTLMTLHISKGLEYPNVFMVGMEQGLFPSFQSFNDSDPTAVEEERRLAYVGMTRARENLTLTYAKSRRLWGQEKHHMPSQFISEIPESHKNHSVSFKRPKFMEKYIHRPSAQGQNHDSSNSSDYVSDPAPDYENFSDEDQNSESSNSPKFTKGNKVRHPVFGPGVIYKVEGNRDDQKVSVVFGNQTFKKFHLKYARLEKI